MKYKIGVDTGGTFTDVVVLDELGTITTGKALTTSDDFSAGVGNAIEVAAEKLSLSLQALLSDTVAFAYGTTIGTNAIATRSGAKVGMLTTKGCRDTIHIARGLSRWTGLSEAETKHMATTIKPPPLVPKQRIVEVQERIDSKGTTVVKLNEDDVRAGIETLKKNGAESIAVCFLWSFRNGEHEAAARDIAAQLYPELYHCTSHEVVPLEGEYERFITTVLDAYVGPATRDYMQSISAFLKSEGLKPRLLLMKADGAIAYSDSVKPVATVHSGPAGGVKATQTLGGSWVITTSSRPMSAARLSTSVSSRMGRRRFRASRALKNTAPCTRRWTSSPSAPAAALSCTPIPNSAPFMSDRTAPVRIPGPPVTASAASRQPLPTPRYYLAT